MSTFDPTKPVQTRDGRKAVILTTDGGSGPYPIQAATLDCTDTWVIETFKLDGSCYMQGESTDDLTNVPEVHPYLKGPKSCFLNFGMGREQYTTALKHTQDECPQFPVIEVVLEDGKVTSTVIHPSAFQRDAS